MKESIFDRVIQSLRQAAQHNSQVMVRPEVILWPDPEKQWMPVISIIQEKIKTLWVYGPYDPDILQGPAIWLKCMAAGKLSGYEHDGSETPVIYLPGISKQDFRNVTSAGLLLQPLIEYQYTGTMWLQENGKEWTVAAFVQNAQSGMGVKVAQDTATKDALLAALPDIFQEPGALYNKTFIDAEYLLSLVYPDIITDILKWMSEGDAFFNSLEPERRNTFIKICKTRFEFEPYYRNIRDITLKLGSRKDAWAQAWEYYANAPSKYPKIPELLRLAKPDDLGTGLFFVPEDSWPQINEDKEKSLRESLLNITRIKMPEVSAYLQRLSDEHQKRKKSVWYEMGLAPLIDSLACLISMTHACTLTYPSSDIEELKTFYITEGYKADLWMRKAFASVRTETDQETVKKVIKYIYSPWLENITNRFQNLLAINPDELTGQQPEEFEEIFVLFVDALRYELAVEYAERLEKAGYNVQLSNRWTALPTLTPTAKPFNSPAACSVSQRSVCNDFRPQLTNGKDLNAIHFRESLQQSGFHYLSSVSDISSSGKSWMESGEIDSRGHQEQSALVRRLDEFFRDLIEIIENAFSHGIQLIKVVTDHGWLLLTGGLPKTELPKYLTETRWGRCALIKEGAPTDFLHLPWQWNPSVYVAYAPGISFFKKNEEYAHGGVSLQECIVPTMLIRRQKESRLTGKINTILWNNLICKIELTGAGEDYFMDIRSKPADETTSVVLSSKEKRIVRDDKCSLMVDDSCEGMAVWVVLCSPSGIIIDKQMTSVGK
jgi:hypothetical protein